MSILEQIASEVFREGKPLGEIIESLVEKSYNQTISKSKGAIRAGVPFQDVVNSLVHSDGLPLKTATSLVFEAQDQVAKQLAAENLLRRANEEAKALFQNGVRYDSVVDAIKGFAADIAEKVAKNNQQYYRA